MTPKYLASVSIFSVQFSSVAQSCPTLCNPVNCSTPGLPVHHQLLEPTQTHVHWVSDTIQPSHPLSSPSPPALNISQHQGLFKWVSSLYQVAKVLEFQRQHQSFHLFPHTNISKLIHFTPSPPQPLWPKTPFSLVLNYYNRLLTVLAASTLTLPQPHLPW